MRARMSHPLTYMEYLKEEAKRAFQNERYHLALQKYEEALQIYLAPKFGFPRHGRDLAQLFSNMANVFIKIRSHEKATQASVASINADPQWIKGYYFLAVALKSKQEYFRALQALLDGLRICTFDDDCLSDVVAELFSVTEDAQNNRSQAMTHYKTVMKELEDMSFQGQVWEKIVSRMSKRGLWKALYILVCTPDSFSNCHCLPLGLNLPQVSLEKLFKVGKPQDLWIHTLSCALIFFGAKVSTIGPFPAHTVLPFAIKSRDFFVLKTVFDTTTTSINLQNKCGETLMHIVAKTKYDVNDIQTEDVRMLLNLHADPCIADIHGKLPKEYLGKNIEALKLIERYLKQASMRKQQPTDTNSQKSATHYADVDARKHHGTTAGAWKPQATSTNAHRPEATSTNARKPQAAGANARKMQAAGADARKMQAAGADARKMQATDAWKSQATAADARKSQAAGANAPKPQVPEKMHPVEVTSEKSTTPNTHKQEEVLEKSGTRQISEQVDPLTEALQRFASVSKRKKKPTKLIDHQDVLPFLTYVAQYEGMTVICYINIYFNYDNMKPVQQLRGVEHWGYVHAICECLQLWRNSGKGLKQKRAYLGSLSWLLYVASLA
uniref:Uncharacterized protein n=1 Tax=Eptatretus burgeri TaxID=7764 RepID=A0A8C4Q3Y0_EPTBU